MPLPSIDRNGPQIVRRSDDVSDMNELQFEEARLDLLKYVNILIRNRWLIIVGTFACALLAIVYTLRLTSVYKGTASFLPSRAQNVTSRMDAQFGARSVYSDSYLQDSRLVEYFSQILSSSFFLEEVARKPVPHPKTGKPTTLVEFYQQEGRTEEERLIKTADIIRENLGVITPRAAAGRSASVFFVSYSASHPVLAAITANAVVDELIAYNKSARSSTTTQNRSFIENQLKDAEELLKKAETDLAQFEMENKLLVTPEPQTVLSRLKRDVRLREDVFFTLTKQLELAKIEEQENKAVIEVIQRAVPPRSRTSPSFRRNAILAFLLGFVLFCGLALGRERLKKMDPNDKSTREFLESLQEVKGDFVKAGRILGVVKRRPGRPKAKA